MTHLHTRAVAGALYSHLQQGRQFLTHAVLTDGRGETVLCRRVQLAHLLDDTCATDPHAPPTCPVCLTRWQRLKAG